MVLRLLWISYQNIWRSAYLWSHFPLIWVILFKTYQRKKNFKKNSTASLCWVPDATIKRNYSVILWGKHDCNLRFTMQVNSVYKTLSIFHYSIIIPEFHLLCELSGGNSFTHILLVLYGCTRWEHIFLGSRKSQTWIYFLLPYHETLTVAGCI